MDPYMYQRQYSNGSNDGCFYEGNGNGHAGGDARPAAVVMNPRGRRTSSEASARRHHGGSGSFSTDEETERPHATGPAPFRSATHSPSVWSHWRPLHWCHFFVSTKSFLYLIFWGGVGLGDIRQKNRQPSPLNGSGVLSLRNPGPVTEGGIQVLSERKGREE